MTRSFITKLLGVGLTLIITFGVSYAQETGKIGTEPPWVYQSMVLLYQHGLIPSYPLEWVGSGNQLSRFEIAYYIKQVIINRPESKQLPTQVVENLQKLIAEYQSELTDLGIKATEINKISPNLVASESLSGGYQDLDALLSKNENKIENKNKNKEPYYYYGQYFKELQRKSFIFIPSICINPDYVYLLKGISGNINIVYQPQLENNPSFLVIEGNLPINGDQNLAGYYLFPIEDHQAGIIGTTKLETNKINNSVLELLDEVNQIQLVDSLWRFTGKLLLDGYQRLETNFQARPLVGNLNEGLKIGSLLVSTPNPTNKNDFEVNNFGLPFYNPHQITSATPVDLDAINGKNLQSLQVNISGSMNLTPQTSIYGGLDLLYRGTNTGLDNLWPSDTKASAGVNYHFNDYWTFLTYQSFVNSQLKAGLLSTTSIGVDYNDWVTLWLAYQLLDFNKPVVSGAVSLRF